MTKLFLKGYFRSNVFKSICIIIFAISVVSMTSYNSDSYYIYALSNSFSYEYVVLLLMFVTFINTYFIYKKMGKSKEFVIRFNDRKELLYKVKNIIILVNLLCYVFLFFLVAIFTYIRVHNFVIMVELNSINAILYFLFLFIRNFIFLILMNLILLYLLVLNTRYFCYLYSFVVSFLIMFRSFLDYYFMPHSLLIGLNIFSSFGFELYVNIISLFLLIIPLVIFNRIYINKTGDFCD